MPIIKHLIVALVLSTLAGCSGLSSMPAGNDISVRDDAWLQDSTDCCQSLEALPTLSLAAHGQLELEFSRDTPVHRFPTGKSPFYVLALPHQAGPLKMTWTSEVQRDAQGNLALFAPHLLILDEQGTVQRRFDWQDFRYQPAQGLQGDRLMLAFGVTPGPQADRIVVITSDAARAARTEMLHPARAYARARSLAEPAVKNPVAAHLASGEVTLRVKPLGEDVGLLAALTDNAQEEVRVLAPTVQQRSRSQVTMDDPLGDIDYRRLIRAALEAKDIALAMQLAERAERAGKKGSRAWLAEQLRRR